MSARTTPLVTIVSPVYNGAKYLRAAADSVLAQDYPNWRYIIADNKSTDGTPQLAEELAQRDPRISVFHGQTCENIMGNWNRAMRQTPAEAEFCSLLCVDDVLFPEFLSVMVDAGMRSPRVGVIGCYRLEGPNISPQSVGHLPPVVGGREMCRLHMSRQVRMFACPSTMMYRAEVVRSRPEFFHPRFLHADVSVCYDVLRDWDFAFAQRLLVYTAMHDQSMTATTANRIGTIPLEESLMTHEFGPSFFEPAELARVIRQNDEHYYREVVRRLVALPKRRELLKHHEKRWADAGLTFRKSALVRAAMTESLSFLLDLRRPIRWLLRRDLPKDAIRKTGGEPTLSNEQTAPATP